MKRALPCLAGAVALVSLASLLALAPAHAMDGPAHLGKSWRDNESAAFAEARAGGRHVVVVFGADWCVPCEKIAQIMNDEKVFGLLSESFVPLYFDLTDLSDRDEALQAKYRVPGLPAVIFVDATGRELDRWDKNLSKWGFIDAMRSVVILHPLAIAESQ